MKLRNKVIMKLRPKRQLKLTPNPRISPPTPPPCRATALRFELISDFRLNNTEKNSAGEHGKQQRIKQ